MIKLFTHRVKGLKITLTKRCLNKFKEFWKTIKKVLVDKCEFLTVLFKNMVLIKFRQFIIIKLANFK